MRRRLGVALLLAAAAVRPAAAEEYVPPPIMPVPDAWQGRAQGVIRVLDKLDAHVETLTLKAGETGRYKSLAVTLRSCMDRPDGLPHDSTAFLDVQDQHGDAQPFSGWSFALEPAIGVFESPVYGVQLVTCQGDLVPPQAPPLPAEVPAPPGLIRQPAPAPADGSGAAGTDDSGSGDGRAAGNPPDAGSGDAAVSPATPPGAAGGDQTDGAQDATPPASGQAPAAAAPHQPAAPPPASAQPDAVYPDGAPPQP